MSAAVDFSAQFGGGDAAEAVLPHFRALKAAAKGHALPGFPFKKLAFILRVDGEVTKYGQSGVGNLDIDDAGDYLSIDIGITEQDRHPESDRGGLAEFIIESIQSSVTFLEGGRDARLHRIDYTTLRDVLRKVCDAYRVEASKVMQSRLH